MVVSARDDGYGTYASAQYMASQIKGAKFLGFDHGGHTWVGHDDEVRAEILKLLTDQAVPADAKPDNGAPPAKRQPGAS